MIVKLYNELTAFEKYKLHECCAHHFFVHNQRYYILFLDELLLCPFTCELAEKIINADIHCITFHWTIPIADQLAYKNQIEKILNMKSFW